jgi:hypothetical protein
MDGIRKASLPLSLAALVLVTASASPAGEPPAPEAVDAPFFRVVPRHNSAGADREIQAKAAESISRQAERDRAVPGGRARHFSWIKPPIVGWSGEILDQAALPSGLRVRVRVVPVLPHTYAAGGPYTDETYLIGDGVARLATIEFSDPNGPRILSCN